jgi:hypothetical protein
MKINQKKQSLKAVLHSFWASYLKWLYLQNPKFSEVFTTEEIINFADHVKLPWIIRQIRAKNELGYYASFYAYVEEFAKSAEMFSSSNMINLDFPCSFSYETGIHRPTPKMLNYIKALASGIISNDEIESMDFQTCSATIDFLLKNRKGKEK